MPRESPRPAPEPLIAVVGAAGLVGAAVRERLEEGPLREWRVRLLESGQREGVITEFAGEAHIASIVDESSFDDADIVMLACSEAETAECLAYPRGKGTSAIVLAAGCAPPGSPTVSMAVNPGELEGRPRVIEAASPVALPLAAAGRAMESACGVASMEAVVFEPASTIGREAMDELYQQTVGILNFGSRPQEVFGRQMAFNLLPLSLAPGQGGEARERAVAGQIGRILGWEASRLSLRMLLAPVFHCHAALVRLTPGREITADGLREALAAAGTFETEPAGASARDSGRGLSGDEAGGGEAEGSDDARTPVEWAGNSGTRIAEIVPDGRGAFWVWMLFDDLVRGSATNAVEIAEALGPK